MFYCKIVFIRSAVTTNAINRTYFKMWKTPPGIISIASIQKYFDPKRKLN